MVQYPADHCELIHARPEQVEADRISSVEPGAVGGTGVVRGGLPGGLTAEENQALSGCTGRLDSATFQSRTENLAIHPQTSRLT